MALLSNDEESPTNSSSGQATDRNGWQRFLPERPLHVLLVEEDSSTRQVVGALLSKCGYEVSSTFGGLEAWNLLKQKDKLFDLVLADAVVQPQSGTDLLANIMSSEVHKDIPVVMMSSHDSLDMVFKCLLKGAKDFLVKPLRKNELRNLWQHVWRRNHAFGRAGSESNLQNKKRKATRNSSSGDTSNDNFSVSRDKNDFNDHKNKSNAQVSGVCESDNKLKLECNEALGNQFMEAHSEVQQLSSPSGQRADSGQNSGASRRSAKAFDFFGTKAAEPFLAEDSPKNQLEKLAQEACHQCQASPVLELSLRGSSSTSYWHDPAGRLGVQWSNSSAFSKYTGKASVIQQPCISRSASLPIDQGPHAPGGHEVTKLHVEIPDKANDKIAAPENFGPQTLHFPKATHYSHGRQFGNCPLTRLSSSGDENLKYAAQDVTAFKSPSLNSSTANNLLQSLKGNPAGDRDRVGQGKEAHFTKPLAEPSCGSDKEDLGSSNANLGRISLCKNTNRVGTYQNNYPFYGDSLHTKPSEADDFASAKEDGAIEDLPAYTVVSGRGSNDGSDKGSSLLEENLAGKSVNCTATLNGNSSGGWHHLAASANGIVDMDCTGATEGNVSDLKPMVYDCRSSFREAALFKFRQKRKMRCFEKKVRYQSRKKLAEQRPRVKGQFVRRAVFDTAAEMKATT